QQQQQQPEKWSPWRQFLRLIKPKQHDEQQQQQQQRQQQQQQEQQQEQQRQQQQQQEQQQQQQQEQQQRQQQEQHDERMQKAAAEQSRGAAPFNNNNNNNNSNNSNTKNNNNNSVAAKPPVKPQKGLTMTKSLRQKVVDPVPLELVKGQQVDYWSESNKCWIPANIVDVNSETGGVFLDAKPSSPVCLKDQPRKIRRRMAPKKEQAAAAHAMIAEGTVETTAARMFHEVAGTLGCFVCSRDLCS
ncbi:unnamed protein product, partial [Polarella glacialis]